MKRLLLTMIIILSLAETATAQMLALRTDAVPYMAFAPNIGAEIVTGNKTSFMVEAIGAYHSFGTNMIAVGASPEFRYWFHGRPMTRGFLGASLFGAAYRWHNYEETAPMAERRTYKGKVGAVALTFGYVWGLGKRERWNMELRGGLGAYRYSEKSRYSVKGTKERPAEKGWAILPYKVGLSFSYILPVEPRNK